MTMIGRVRIDARVGGSNVHATLGPDGQWSCPGYPDLVLMLNAAYSPRDDGPADGQPGYRQIAAVAAWAGTEPEYGPVPPAPADARF